MCFTYVVIFLAMLMYSFIFY